MYKRGLHGPLFLNFLGVEGKRKEIPNHEKLDNVL
tara:strand:+ start:63 stop:167 length:105 start_codon:yes stop_codon:yes gene_type:complete